jgi:hypothetical protein
MHSADTVTRTSDRDSHQGISPQHIQREKYTEKFIHFFSNPLFIIALAFTIGQPKFFFFANKANKKNSRDGYELWGLLWYTSAAFQQS